MAILALTGAMGRVAPRRILVLCVVALLVSLAACGGLFALTLVPAARFLERRREHVLLAMK